MCLGNPILEGKFYKFPVLNNQFLIKYNNEKYYVLSKGGWGALMVISTKNTLQEAKEFLVKYINENRKVSFPNLTL